MEQIRLRYNELMKLNVNERMRKNRRKTLLWMTMIMKVWDRNYNTQQLMPIHVLKIVSINYRTTKKTLENSRWSFNKCVPRLFFSFLSVSAVHLWMSFSFPTCLRKLSLESAQNQFLIFEKFIASAAAAVLHDFFPFFLSSPHTSNIYFLFIFFLAIGIFIPFFIHHQHNT